MIIEMNGQTLDTTKPIYVYGRQYSKQNLSSWFPFRKNEKVIHPFNYYKFCCKQCEIIEIHLRHIGGQESIEKVKAWFKGVDVYDISQCFAAHTPQKAKALYENSTEKKV